MHAGVGVAAVKTEPGLFSANDYFSPHTPSTPSIQDPVAIASGADPEEENATAVSNNGTLVSQIIKNESNTSSVDDSDRIVRPDFKRESSLSNSDSKRSLTPKVLSKSATPVPLKRGAAPMQLIGHLLRAEEAAFATFERLETNWYQYKTLGRSKVQEDAMSCECQFRPGILAFFSDLWPVWRAEPRFRC
jgi:[histone H3]-lysine36 N-trimethyltransferase